MKILWVGDLHIKVQNLDDSEKLMKFILDNVPGHDAVVLAGDIYDSHGVIHASVQTLVCQFFMELSKVAPITFNLEGNHDVTGDGQYSSLFAHLQIPNVIQVSSGTKQPFRLHNLSFVPFYRSSEVFLSTVLEARKNGAKFVFCHQEITGAQYDNGFYSKDGIDVDRLPADINFISGHIHKHQCIKNFSYLGTPRALTKSDVNQKKGIYSLTIGKDSSLDIQFIDTSTVVPEFHEFNFTTKDALPDFPDKDRIYVNALNASDESVKAIKEKYKSVYVKAVYDNGVKNVIVSESIGVRKSVENLLSSFRPKSDKIAFEAEIKNRMSYGG